MFCSVFVDLLCKAGFHCCHNVKHCVIGSAYAMAAVVHLTICVPYSVIEAAAISYSLPSSFCHLMLTAEGGQQRSLSLHGQYLVGSVLIP